MFLHARKEEQTLKKRWGGKGGAALIIDARKKFKNNSFLPGLYKHECLLIVSVA